MACSEGYTRVSNKNINPVCLNLTALFGKLMQENAKFFLTSQNLCQGEVVVVVGGEEEGRGERTVAQWCERD